MQLSFDGYCLDLASRQLMEGPSEVRLSPKAFDLLQALIENRARALSKAELHDRLWPGTFVTDANLAVLVAELRSALHDRADAPRFVRTVRGFGYAFCGEVSDAVEMSPGRRCWVVWNGREIALREGDNIIGRDPGVAVRLDLPSVSRRHARIVVSSSSDMVVEDLGSKNGTFLRDGRIASAVRLADLDELQVGSARLMVRILSDDAKTQTIGDG